MGGIIGEIGKLKVFEEKLSLVKSVLGGVKIGDISVYKLVVEGSKGYV